jgi:Protein of unknown function (DUF2877)
MYVAAASKSLRPMLAGPARPAELLGLSRGALYLKTTGHPGVLVVLCHDAVRLPCGLLLPTTSAEVPLTSLVPHSTALVAARPASFVVGDGAVSWMGPAGPVVVRAVREWAPARPAQGKVAASALAAVRTVPGLSGADPGADSRTAAGLANAARDYDASVAVASRLLGSGPGLTPSGDDVLAGFLAGAFAFGLDAAALRQAIAVLAPARTTALSAALLWHAARGECIDELAAVAAVLTGQRLSGPEVSSPELGRPEEPGRAVSRLLSVGHTSGAALALGLVIAAENAVVGRRPVLATTVVATTGLAKKGRAA